MWLLIAQDDRVAMQLSAAVIQARQMTGYTPKQMAGLMGITEQQLDRQLRPDQYPGQHISIFRLARMPWNYWGVFLPLLVAVIVRASVVELYAHEK